MRKTSGIVGVVGIRRIGGFLAIVGVVSLAALLALSRAAGAAAAGAPAADQTDAGFKEWIKGVAAAQKVEVCAWGLVGLDKRKQARFAVLNPKNETSAWVLIERGRAVWALPLDLESGESFNAPLTALDCSDPPAGGAERPFAAEPQIKIEGSGMSGLYASLTISVDDQGPVQIDNQVMARYESGGENLDKLLRTASTMEWNDEGEETNSSSSEVPLLLVRPPKAPGRPVPAARSRVTFGRKNLKGAKDAAIAVKATAVATAAGERAVRLSIDVQDDAHVPLAEAPDDKAWLAADHLEIWLAPGTTMSGDAQGPAVPAPAVGGTPPATPALQLGVAFPAQGPPAVRWLHPAGTAAPLPAVTGGPKRVEIDLPIGTLGIPAATWEAGWRCRLTVVFSDSDAAGKGQQTMVATSPLRWGNVETFGELLAFPGFRRFRPLAVKTFKSRREAGELFVPPSDSEAPCSPGKRAEQRAAAARLQKAGKQAEALRAIEELIAACDKKVGRWDLAWLSSDLALIRHGNGDDRGCSEALDRVGRAPDMPPRLRRAVAFNRGLCGGDCDKDDATCAAGRTARTKRADAKPRP